jgi:hypothetical protein
MHTALVYAYNYHYDKARCRGSGPPEQDGMGQVLNQTNSM